MKNKKGIAVFLCVILLAAVLCGCGEKDSSEKGVQKEKKGRYVETKVDLPKQLDGWTLRQLYTVDDKLRMLASKQEGGRTLLKEWEQQEEGFAEVTADWLGAVELYCGEWMDLQLVQGADGTQYLYAGYVAEGEEQYMGHLWKGKDTEASEITPEKWTVPDEQWGGYEMVQGIAALDNGTLVSVSYTSVDLLDGTEGQVLESDSSSFYEKVLSDGANIYLCSSSATALEIEKRPDGKRDGAINISFAEGGSGAISLCVMKDGTMIAAGGNGIFRGTKNAEDVSWERLLAGQETDFSLTECWCTGMAALEDGRIYALFQQSGGGAVLNQYEYDPEAVIEIAQELKLYTVYESYLLQQAAAMYHREHPEVLITIEYVYPRYYYDETDYNAVYQELNTRLMGEDAPDILVMDHLNIDSYAEKGLLADINDVVAPLEESGELLANITGAYVQEDGSRYVIPLQFGFKIALGRDISAENMESLEALSEFLGKEEYSYLGAQTVTELVDKFYPFFCDEIVNGKELDRESLSRNLEFLKAVADNCGLTASRGKDEKGFNMWDLASGAKLAFDDGDGFKNCMTALAIVEYIKGEFTAFEKAFVPLTQIGICSKTKYMDTAKDFLQYALSREIQDTDHYSGFPVNSGSLEKQAHEDRSEAEAETAIEADGGYIDFQILDFKPEVADKLVAICRTLEKPIGEDEKIREVLIECLEGYLSGSSPKEDTVERIEDSLKMYLAE